jgi:hypothetical protein
MKKVGVVVVHGIGDPAPGEALENFTDALALDTPLAFEPSEARRLPEPHKGRDYLSNFFPMFVRRAHRLDDTGANAVDYVFAEVFWGSASQLPLGWGGVLQGLLRLFVRSDVIIRQASPKPKTERALPFYLRGYFGAARLISHLITGPILGLNILWLKQATRICKVWPRRRSWLLLARQLLISTNIISRMHILLGRMLSVGRRSFSGSPRGGIVFASTISLGRSLSNHLALFPISSRWESV